MRINSNLIKTVTSAQAATIVICATAVYLTFNFYTTRILPNTTINSIAVGGLTIEEAVPKIQAELAPLPTETITIQVDDIGIASSSGELGLHHVIDDATTQAFLRGKSGSLPYRLALILVSPFNPAKYQTGIAYDKKKLSEMIEQLAAKVDIEGAFAHASLKTSGNPATITIFPGEPGRVINTPATAERLQNNLTQQTYLSTAIVASTSAVLTEDQIQTATERVEKFVGKSVVFSEAQDQRLRLALNDQDLVEMLLLPEGVLESALDATVTKWSEEIGRPAQNPEFVYDENTLQVETFSPPKTGLALNREQTTTQIRDAIREIDASLPLSESQSADPIALELAIEKTEPEVSLSETNNLGIKELIGFGDSHYDHSIPNRIHNVALTTSRITDTIVPPGEEFSFNKTLGEVSNATGFRSAYVIRNGRTELGDGGGVCQVSTTVFRAVLNAGLDVTRRLQHSYRVSYYELDEKPGVDATVYAGNVDLRFVNDTDEHILVHAQADSDNLYMYVEIYGTSDGRTTEIVDHKTWDTRPALPPEYIDDPTLPTGQVKQVDWAAAGIKASFKNIVRDAEGEIIREEEYYSNYRPWSAKYLVGTG